MDFKYIIIPEYAHLFAMEKCFGPLHSPLTQPTPTPIDIIKLLLLQNGADKVSVYEVKKIDDGTFSEPIQLTIDNYDISYDKITGTEVKPKSGIGIIDSKDKEPESIDPTILTDDEQSSVKTTDNPSKPVAVVTEDRTNDNHSTHMTKEDRITAKKSAMYTKNTETNK